MAGQPAFDARAGVDLGVELKTQDIAAERETLGGAERGGREILGTLGNFEGVAMPVQHGHTLKMTERAGAARVRQGQLRKADLLHAVRGDLGAERRRDLLCAEADTERRQVRGETGLENAALVIEEGIELRLIDTDGSAQDHQQAGKQWVQRPKLVNAQVVVVNTITGGRQYGLERAEILEIYVTDGDRRLERGRSPLRNSPYPTAEMSAPWLI